MKTIRLYLLLLWYGVKVGYWEARHERDGARYSQARAVAYRTLMDEVGHMIQKG